MVSNAFIIVKLFASLIVIIIAFRLMGRSYMKENTPLDIANIVILGGFVSIMATGRQYSIKDTVLVIIGWLTMIYILDTLKYHFTIINNLILGNKKIIIINGNIYKKTLKKERITEKELYERLRENQVYSIDEVEKAFLESNGSITVKRKKK